MTYQQTDNIILYHPSPTPITPGIKEFLLRGILSFILFTCPTKPGIFFYYMIILYIHIVCMHIVSIFCIYESERALRVPNWWSCRNSGIFLNQSQAVASGTVVQAVLS